MQGPFSEGKKCLGRVTRQVELFLPRSGNVVNELITFKKHVACRPTFNCHQQMAIYAEEPLGGGKQTTHLLNHGISV
jgi:hypothetical protein